MDLGYQKGARNASGNWNILISRKTLVTMRRDFLTGYRSDLSVSGMANAKKKNSRSKAILLGVGLDSDGHKRVTTGPNFALVGGSQETHEVMTEKVIKINEKLASKGKKLENVSAEEFDDIAHSVGLKRPDAK
jgi:hypothetical protein